VVLEIAVGKIEVDMGLQYFVIVYAISSIIRTFILQKQSPMRPEEEESNSGASSGGGEDMNLQDSSENGHAVDKPRDPERSRDLFGVQLEVCYRVIFRCMYVTCMTLWATRQILTNKIPLLRLIVAHSLKKFPTFYVTGIIITMFTLVQH
jgi:hypothetical protein